MTDTTDLIERLRRYDEDCAPTALEIKAADALEAQAREIERLTKLLSGRARWHEIEVLESRLAAAVWPCKTYDKDGKLLTVCHDLAAAERERDEARVLLRGVREEWGVEPELRDRIDAFLAKHKEQP